MNDNFIRFEPYNGDETCEYEEFHLTEPDATLDDILLIPDALVIPQGICNKPANWTVRVSDDLGDDVSRFCDEHKIQQIESFNRDFDDEGNLR